MYSIQLQTTYGPAAFSFLLDENGRLTEASCPTLDLPDALLKLSYPSAGGTELRREMEAWLPVLPWLVEPALWTDTPPEYLLAVHRAFRENCTDYEARRARLLATDPTATPEDATPHWARVSALFQLEVAGKIIRLPSARSSEQLIFSATKKPLTYRKIAATWLATAFPLADISIIDEWLTALGKTRTTAANEFLFRQLERPGYLYAAKQVFTVLANSRLKLDNDRIIALYEDEDTLRDNVSSYVHLLNKLPFPAAKPLLERIVQDYSLDCLSALKRLNRHDKEVARENLRRLFEQTDDYKVLSATLRYAVELYGREQDLITLLEINDRLAEPVFLDNAQVTWPQKLSIGWEQILFAASRKQMAEVIAKYLQPDQHGRINRNLLLQLKEYLAYHRSGAVTLSAEQEQQLLILLQSRHDKVSTVATDLIQMLFDDLRDKEAATDAILRHFVTSRYRLMDAGVLKVAAGDPELAQRQVDFFLQLVVQATTEEQRKQVKKMLPYLRFLPQLEAIKERL